MSDKIDSLEKLRLEGLFLRARVDAMASITSEWFTSRGWTPKEADNLINSRVAGFTELVFDSEKISQEEKDRILTAIKKEQH